MKCESCRKAEVLDTIWDKVRLWLFRRFEGDINDFRMDYYTQGISEGYKLGFKQAIELQKQYEDVEKLATEISTLHSDSG